MEIYVNGIQFGGPTHPGFNFTGGISVADVNSDGIIELAVAGGTASGYPAGAPALSGAKFVPIFGSNLAVGDNDLYTVPVGKKALIAPVFTVLNTPGSGGTMRPTNRLKIGGVYYTWSSTFGVTADGAQINTNSQVGIVLNAGEIVAMNISTTPGANVRGAALEFDATDTRLFSARILGLAAGDQTLYTCPVGKMTVFLGGSSLGVSGFGNQSIVVVNAGAGSINYYSNVVPSGGSVAISNRESAVLAIAAAANTLGGGAPVLAAGDFINVNASAGDPVEHHIAWVTGYELPVS
jgi:hypothetical protein